MISGSCTFFFKDIADESPLGQETDNKTDAAVPTDSILVFAPTQSACVSAFRIRLSVRTGNGTEPRLIERADRSGKCWSSADFDCGPADS